MTIDEIIAYIMYTPENTNPAILREQLNSIAPSSGAAENGGSLGNAFVFQPNENNATFDEETQTTRLNEELSNNITAAYEEDLIIGIDVNTSDIYKCDYIDANSENSPITDGFMLIPVINHAYILSYDAVIPDQEALTTYISNLNPSHK